MDYLCSSCVYNYVRNYSEEQRNNDGKENTEIIGV